MLFDTKARLDSFTCHCVIVLREKALDKVQVWYHNVQHDSIVPIKTVFHQEHREPRRIVEPKPAKRGPSSLGRWIVASEFVCSACEARGQIRKVRWACEPWRG